MNSLVLKKYIKDHGSFFLISLCSIIIVWLCLEKLDLLTGVRIMDDEYAYWGVGAYFAGFKWESMRYSSYYSYGYGILLLPLFLLMKAGLHTVTVYKIAIMMNVLALLGSFWLSLALTSHFCIKIPKTYRVFCCFITALYINNIVQASFAWDESLLYFMFWLVLFFLIRVVERPIMRNIVPFVALSLFIMMVHMRAVGVSASAIFVVLLFIIGRIKEKKTGRKELIGFLFLLFFGILIFYCGKEFATNYIYQNHDTANTMAGQAGKIQALFTRNGLLDFFNSLMGKIFYFGTATFMMAGAGICYGVYVLFRKVYKRLQKDRTDIFTPETWGILFVELSVGAELAISALFMNYRFFGQSQVSDRIDAIYYGRYADFVVGPVLLAGLLLLYFVQKNMKFFLVSLFITGGTSLVVQYLFDGGRFYLNFDGFVGNLSTYAGIYPFFGGDYTNLAFRVFSFSVLVFISCILCTLFFRRMSVPFVGGLVLACLLVGIWGYNGLRIVEAEAVEKNWRDKNYRSVAELTEKIDFQGEIYFVEKANGGNTKWMQWWIPTTPIHIIDLEEFDNLYQQGVLKEALVLSNTRDGSTTGKLSDSMHYVYDSGAIGVFVQPDSQLEGQMMGQAAACYEYPDPHWYEVDLSVASTSLCERKPGGNLYHAQGKEGYLTWETGLSLEDGQYEFVLEMEIHGEGNIGYITVSNEEETWMDTRALEETDFNGQGIGKIHVFVPAQNFERPVVGIYTYGNHTVSVRKISYRQISARASLTEDVRLNELGQTVVRLAQIPGLQLDYVDSDNSGKKGFMDVSLLAGYFPGGVTQYITGNLLKYKKAKENQILLVENVKERYSLFQELLRNYVMIDYKDNYSLWISKEEKLLEKVNKMGIPLLLTGEDEIDLSYLGESRSDQGSSYRVTLEDGQYIIRTSIDAAEPVEGWLSVGEQKVRITDHFGNYEFYIQDGKDIEISLLPDDKGKWKEAQCTIAQKNKNRTITVPFEDRTASGVLRLSDCYSVENESAKLETAEFTLGARRYGISVVFSQRGVAGKAQFFRNDELWATVDFSEAEQQEDGSFCLEYRMEDYDQAKWKVDVTIENQNMKEILLPDHVRVIEYVE